MTISIVLFSFIGILLILWFYFIGKKLDKQSEEILKRISELENEYN
jgi:type VI protein secretion system component VasF